MSEQKELILRVKLKVKELQVELSKMENDIINNSSNAKVELEKKIKEVSADLANTKEEISESIAKKFNDWLS